METVGEKVARKTLAINGLSPMPAVTMQQA